MKKLVVMSAAICAALLIVGCSSGPTPSEGMSSAKRSVPDNNSLVGQASGADAKTAESEAKYQLTRGMSFMVKDMVDEAVAAKALDAAVAEQFRQAVNTALGRINLSSAVQQGAGQGKQGKVKLFWAVYYMSKADVVKVINQAVNAGKTAFPAASSFTTDGRIDKAFATQASKEWRKG